MCADTRGDGGIESLTEIRKNVVDVLDADTQTDHLGRDAGFLLFRRVHLSMCCRRRMTRQGLRIPKVDDALDEGQRIVKLRASRETAADAERHDRAGTTTEVLLGQLVIRA